jgi:hypothetical protein
VAQESFQKKGLKSHTTKYNAKRSPDAVNYTFTYSTGTYTNLTGSTNASAGQIWDDPELYVPIGFTFKFFSDNFDSLIVSDPYLITFNDWRFYMTVYGADLVDRAFGSGGTTPLSPISYVTEGTAPNRIFKLEWKNAAFLNELIKYSKSTNYTNMQLWLYETTNAIEFRYGPHLVTFPDTIYEFQSGPAIGISNDVALSYNFLVGDSSKPTVSTIPFQTITGTPTNGQIYKFAPQATSISVLNRPKVEVYPNPAMNNIRLLFPEASELYAVSIVDPVGQVLLTKTVKGVNDYLLNIENLLPGTYYVKVVGDNNIWMSSFIKTR